MSKLHQIESVPVQKPISQALLLRQMLDMEAERAESRARLESFNATYGAKIDQAIEGLRVQATGEPHPISVATPILLTFALKRLRNATSAADPQPLEMGGESGNDHVNFYQNGTEMLAYLKSRTSELEQDIEQIYQRHDARDSSTFSERERGLIDAYGLISHDLLPAWENDNYLQQIGEITEKLARRHEPKNQISTEGAQSCGACTTCKKSAAASASK